jgi:predicted nucleotide-binding protein
MDLERARRLMAEHSLDIIDERQLAHGTQLITAQGAILTIYDSGKCVPGGKRADLLKPILEGDDGRAVRVAGKTVPPAARKVFVVYGHEPTARGELEAMLRRWGLEPLILDQLPSGGQTIIEKLESARQEANYAVVLATADDEGHRKDRPDEKLLRARQNVVLELGMMLALLGRRRVAILLPSSANMERPSDIHGLIYIPYKDNVTEAGLTLAKEIDAQGIHINLSKV